jgi:FMN phosphatase YigB (HAD superfamily)
MRLFPAALICCITVATAQASAPESDKICYTPANLIIATDLDDVVLKKRNGAIALTVLRHLYRAVSFYRAYRANKKEGDSVGQRYGEGFYLYLLSKGEIKLAKIVRKVCTRKRLKMKTVKIMPELAGQGFELYTATNIGHVFFAKLQKRVSEVFNDQCIRYGMTVDFAEIPVVQKPNPLYFQRLKQHLCPNGDKQILFIDDKLENVEAARAEGLLAIHFVGHKQLKAALEEYGIYLA